jgi:A/G-specific adenine glycosylase
MISVDWNDKVVTWYHKQEVLPWQETEDPYLVWISEVMLQQTTVAVVKYRFKQWLQVFPTIHHLALANQDAVLTAFAGLGYYNRAKNLHKMAQIIDKEGWPQQLSQLKKLPGLGEYTSRTILSRCFQQPLLASDVNVLRVMQRLLGYLTSNPAFMQQLDQYFIPLFQQYPPAIVNQAWMRFGQYICQKRQPQCQQCFLSEGCQAYQHNLQYNIPQQKTKKKIEEIESKVMLCLYNDQILLEKRQQGIGQGMMALPRITAQQLQYWLALGYRHIIMPVYTHTYTRYREKLTPHIITINQLPNAPTVDLPHCQWYPLNTLTQLPFLAIYVRIIHAGIQLANEQADANKNQNLLDLF